jgi:hypothetical protein
MPTNFASAQRGWHASMGPRGLDSGSGCLSALNEAQDAVCLRFWSDI